MKYQIAIIGGGPAGYTAAEVAGKAGLSVVLFEKRSLGGVCLNEAFPQRHCSNPPKCMIMPSTLPNMRSLCPKLLLTWERLLPGNQR